ncbi:amidohydrolase family protein, partial [Planctomycetota bacterium]
GGHPSVTVCRGSPWFRSELSVEVDDEGEGRKTVRQLAEKRVDAIKVVYHGSTSNPAGAVSFEKLSVDVMRAIIDESHQHGLKVTVHTWREQDAIVALESGADGLEHGVVDAPLGNDRLAQILLDRNAFYVPTLRVLTLGKNPVPLETAQGNLKDLTHRGVRIAVGTDTLGDQPRGLNTILEMQLMAEAGMAPAQIIRAATHDAADHLGLLERLGTVEPGKIADLIIVDGDPLKDMSVLHKVEIVIQRGHIAYNRNGE